MRTLLDDAEHWWSRAEETRTIAELMQDAEAKRIGHHLFTITEGSPTAFRIVSSSHQLIYEWHVGDDPKH